jgi:lipid-A-disaccharide synthase
MPSVLPTDDLSIIGFTAIPRKLPTILRHIRTASNAALAAKPDVLVIIDSPDFSHRVARRVRKANPGIPIIDYVCPSVWAWRPGRARAMRRYIDLVLALLPFEPQALRDLHGPPGIYVGHPLTEVIDELRPNDAEARRRAADPPVLLILPGSRRGEIRRHLAVFGEAVMKLRERVGPLDLVLPTVPSLAATVQEMTAHWPQPPRILVDIDDKRSAFRVARAALAKSGTVTLELALAGVPMVTAYKVSAIEAFVAARMIRVPSVILANLVLGAQVVPEFLQTDCTPDRLAEALVPLLGDTAERRRQLADFARLDTIMEIGTAWPARRAADAVLERVQQKWIPVLRPDAL